MKKIVLLLFLVSNASALLAQDWVPVLNGFSYNASTCRLAFSCFVKNNDQNSDADPTSYKIIIFNISDNSEVFDTDVTLDALPIGGSSEIKSWTIDLPALAGYRPSESYKIAVVANTLGKFEFDKKNNRAESPQFSCGSPSLNNAPAKKAGEDTKEKSAKETHEEAMKEHDESMKELDADIAEMKAAREKQLADKKAAQEQEKATLTSKVQNLEGKIARRIAERDQLTVNTKEWSDLAYEVRDLELEKSISQTKLEQVTDEIAYGTEGMTKTEKESYKTRLDKYETEQKETRKKQKDGLIYGQTSSKSAKAEPVEEPKEEKNKEKESAEDEEIKIYTAEEMANMSTITLKKVKVNAGGAIARRNFTLKTKKALLKPEEKAKFEKEILDLENQQKLVDAELLKREGTEGEK